MQSKTNLIIALSVSIFLHIGLIILLTYNSFGSSKVLNQVQLAKNNKPIIKSYVYQPANQQTPQPLTMESNITPQLSSQNTLSVVEKNVTETTQEQTKAPAAASKNEMTETVQQHQATTQTNSLEAKPSDPFNPYKGIATMIEQREQALLAQELKDERKTKGISPMHQPYSSVPKRIVNLTPAQQKEQATTVVGNETIIKFNGVCSQTTDLSFIDDNLGKVASFSDCGETDDERYYREFMKKRLSKHLKK